MPARTSVKFFAFSFLFLLLLAIAGLIAEIAFTLSDRYALEGIEYSASEIWRWRKNLNVTREQEEGTSFSLHTDKNGFRNCGKNYLPDSNVIRVLVIGDSYTIGLDYPQEKIFTSLLEKQLNEAAIVKKKIEVFNMASPAWGTEQQFMCLKNCGVQIKPDYLLLMTCPNDIREAYNKRYAELVNGEINFNPIPFNCMEIWHWKLSNYSCFYQYLQKKVLYSHYGSFTMLSEKFRFNFGREDVTNWDRPLFLKNSFAEVDSAWKLYAEFLAETKKICQDQNIRFTVSSTPFIIEFDETMRQDTTMQPGFVSEKIQQYCEHLEVPYLNLYKSFKLDSNVLSCFRKNDQHFTAHGHAASAVVLADYYKHTIKQ